MHGTSPGLGVQHLSETLRLQFWPELTSWGFFGSISVGKSCPKCYFPDFFLEEVFSWGGKVKGSSWAGVEPEVLRVSPSLLPPLPKCFCASLMNWCLQLGDFCASLPEIQVWAEVPALVSEGGVGRGKSFCSWHFWASVSSPHHPGLSLNGYFLPASTGQLWEFRKEKNTRIIKMLHALSGVQVPSWGSAGHWEFSSFRPLRAVSTEEMNPVHVSLLFWRFWDFCPPFLGVLERCLSAQVNPRVSEGRNESQGWWQEQRAPEHQTPLDKISKV